MAGRKVTPGSPFIPSAGEWNRHVDTADYIDRFRLGTGSPAIRGSSDTNIVWTKNDSGANRRKGDILEFTGLAFTNLDDDDRGWMVGGSPSLANGFGVLLKAVPNGDFAYLQVAGQCFAYVNVNDADDKYARVTSATYVLQSCALGPVRIIYKPSGTGEKKCKVLLPQAPDQNFVGKPAGNKSMGATDLTVNLYDKYGGSSLGVALTNCIALTRDLTTDDWVGGSIINGIGHAAPIDCEA